MGFFAKKLVEEDNETMLLKDALKKGDLHHAYCIEGDFASELPHLVNFFEDELSFETKGNPDFWHEHFETFSIDESRKLKDREDKTSFGGRKIFVLSFRFITREAQNALLKIFEEPTPSTHFFIITPTADILLPTLRSRLVVLKPEIEGQSEIEIEKILKASPADRLNKLKGVIEEKDRGSGIEILNEIERFYSKKDILKLSHEEISFLLEVGKLKKFLFSSGSSVKLVLEHVALTLPN